MGLREKERKRREMHREDVQEQLGGDQSTGLENKTQQLKFRIHNTLVDLETLETNSYLPQKIGTIQFILSFF